MRAAVYGGIRFAALGDSLTEGVGDPAPDGAGRRGWAALLAGGLAPAEVAVEFRNFAVSGAQTQDVWRRQTPQALAFGPDVVSVVVGVNDTLRHTFDIHRVAARLDAVHGAFAERGALLLTACLPDPGALLGLPGALARPLARRQRAVNTVVHALSERYGAVHVHAADGEWVADRAMWSADRLHPGEAGHRALAVRFHAQLRASGRELGPEPALTAERPPPSRTASLTWLATAGTGWVLRRCTDLLPQLAALAAEELRHELRGTGSRLDLRASAAVSAALASVGAAAIAPASAGQRGGVGSGGVGSGSGGVGSGSGAAGGGAGRGVPARVL
ncbi:SGNH/GDSL hydrolase family protein [Streptomyces sp. B-S-A8]|uniref:SGNH/GDSL hydrolase family protein n=1 Tax=Streptomyces solicavernae TaxID=3043614 RepID=A0ABT6RQG7_9ACTN|nr:SGNH/GDSL hydrolase family protein [Streptomyces sp. B-S-A8]MDI3386673.1 SGNH/GDSL hydrolase family protein [Streptomyces sp. B-S-A8]